MMEFPAKPKESNNQVIMTKIEMCVCCLLFTVQEGLEPVRMEPIDREGTRVKFTITRQATHSRKEEPKVHFFHRGI